MSLAQRIRDFRYSKGWGPDELANRAEISRTALYQIESGKTELPRAGTLRRIAVALEVPMEELLGSGTESEVVPAPVERSSAFRPPRARMGWPSLEDVPVRVKAGSPFAGLAPNMVDDPRHTAEPVMKARTLPSETPFAREGELMSKLHELLHSPFGDCITSIVDDLHQVLTQVSTIN
jgi:transcriptional regulator with XRE-family HTH domain